MHDLLWTPDMSVGCDMLDDDHRAILGLVQRLDCAVRGGEPFDVVGSLLTVGMELTRAHAAREEHLGRLLGQPVDAAHLHAHGAFTAWTEGVRAEYLSGRDLGRLRAVLPVMEDWWLQHVCDLDMADRALYLDQAERIAGLARDGVLAEPMLDQAPLQWPEVPAPVLGLRVCVADGYRHAGDTHR